MAETDPPDMSVRVVIPCYNHAASLARAIESVLDQAQPVDDIVVVDDGSTDGSAAVAERYAPKVRCIVQANAGVSAARNRGAEECGQAWLAFLDADDRWRPEKWQVQREVLASHPGLDVLMSDFWHVADSGEFLDTGSERHRVGMGTVQWDRRDGPEVWFARAGLVEALVRDYMICMGATIIRRDAFAQAGGFARSYSTCEDLDLFLRLAKAGRTFGYVPRPLAEVVQVAGSLSRKNPRVNESRLAVLSALEREFPLGPSEARAVRRARGDCELGLAWQAFSAGRFAESRAHARQAVRNGRRVSGLRAWVRALPGVRRL